MYDAIVIGAGLNGLATAAYLGKAGRTVLVLERRPTVGGAAVTEELAPGYRVDTCAHDAGWVSPDLVRELDLVRHGVAMLRADAAVFTPSCDGKPLTLWRDARRTSEGLRARSARDAERWGDFARRMAAFAGFLGRVYASPAPLPTSRRAGDLLALASLGRRMRALGTSEMVELLRVLPMSAGELLDDWFESDLLKGALGGAAVTGVCHGPRSAGTAFVMLDRQVGEDVGAFRARSYPRGGIGALAAALASAARANGVEIRTNAAVTRVLVKNGRAEGVVLDGSGDEILARAVASSADPRHTFLTLAGPTNLEPEFVRAVRHIRYRGVMAKVNFALSELPTFAGVNGDATALAGMISIAPSLDYLERAYDDAKHGRVSARPYLEATIPSLLDDSLAPRGHHVMSVRMQYAPYRPKDGAWTEDRRSALCDQVVETISQYAPNFADTVVAHQVLTPADIECVYGAPEGNLDHGEMALDQVLFMRPVPGWARYRTPIESLFLCGAGAHPGGRVVGGAGRLAAREILRGGRAR